MFFVSPPWCVPLDLSRMTPDLFHKANTERIKEITLQKGKLGHLFVVANDDTTAMFQAIYDTEQDKQQVVAYVKGLCAIMKARVVFMAYEAWACEYPEGAELPKSIKDDPKKREVLMCTTEWHGETMRGSMFDVVRSDVLQMLIDLKPTPFKAESMTGRLVGLLDSVAQ